MTDPKLCRSRTAWPGPMSTAGVKPGHSHDLPNPLVQRVRMLTWAVVIFGVSLVAVGTLLVLLIAQRGEQRDMENTRTNERINHAICDLLDQLPQGGLLDRPRVKYGCGPGLPLSMLTPEEQRLIDRPSISDAQPDPPAPSRPVLPTS